ncbi:Two-component sensor histidine kinase, contains HisKA and HATPase domains [Rhizobium sp. RU20A]|uniref:sensor histidine kinase n=1 Tax=Rhizobium sp. RU20A TaxID=1907412 RepID=UPI000957547C|nr:HWE histidine kinase domain-containing protein [Rhizobium sp. RU20A]SIQ72328.1 Two-component sensor histidine kinase, contains HisKA and HATPase domains [Rhizobium sp. RU20A]
MTLKTAWFSRFPNFDRRAERRTAVIIAGHYAAAAGISLLAAFLRHLADPYLPPGFPFLTFFPAVILTGFMLGIGPGTFAAILCGLIAWVVFIPPPGIFGMTPAALLALAFYAAIVTIDLWLIHLLTKAFRAERKERTEKERLADQQDVLARELDHRLKNIFATMGAVISLSQRHAETPRDLAAMLRDRMDAMGRSNLLLRGVGGLEQATLAAVVEQSLAPFSQTGSGRIEIAGPDVPLVSQAVLSLSLILHELGTNAAKYGALSSPSGLVRVQWSMVTTDDKDHVSIDWIERGGPPPKPATKQGFGSTLQQRVISGMGGQQHTRLPPEGAEVRLMLPLAAITPREDEG